jgi:hypothetical protein
MDPTLYFLSALGVATLVGLLLSGCAYLIIFQSPLFAHVNLEPTAINLELVNRTQSVNNSGEISSWGYWSIFCCVDLIWLLQPEIKGVGYWIWGWLVRVVGFRTGVRNFVGAGLGFWKSTFVFLDLGLLWGKFLGALVGHSLVCVVPGGDHFFLSCHSFHFFVLFFGSVEPQEVCWDILNWWVSPHHNK